MGATSPTNGDSTMQQTITNVPANATLSFWYQPHCPDTLTYDQEQMQIRPSGTAPVSVVNVCDNSGTWKNATASLAAYAGQSVVLWFNNHDDNYAGDPTYTLFDDIAVSGTGLPPEARRTSAVRTGAVRSSGANRHDHRRVRPIVVPGHLSLGQQVVAGPLIPSSANRYSANRGAAYEQPLVVPHDGQAKQLPARCICTPH